MASKHDDPPDEISEEEFEDDVVSEEDQEEKTFAAVMGHQDEKSTVRIAKERRIRELMKKTKVKEVDKFTNLEDLSRYTEEQLDLIIEGLKTEGGSGNAFAGAKSLLSLCAQTIEVGLRIEGFYEEVTNNERLIHAVDALLPKQVLDYEDYVIVVNEFLQGVFKRIQK